MGWKSFTKKLSSGLGMDHLGSGFVSGKFTDFGEWWDGTSAARKQMAMQDEYNMKYWNLQNEYNSPAAQMARYKEAGLNPNLIYSQSNTAGAIGSVSPGHISSGAESAGKAMSMLSSVYGILNMKAQNKNLNQQTSNLQAQEKLSSSQADYVSAQADRYRYETEWLKNHDTSSYDNNLLRGAKSLFSSAPESYFNLVDRLDDVSNAISDSVGPRTWDYFWQNVSKSSKKTIARALLNGFLPGLSLYHSNQKKGRGFAGVYRKKR